MKCDMEKAIAVEREEHPWADEEIARKLVEDHLRDDPDYYAGAGEDEGEEGDPYPEHGEEHHGHGKPALVISIGGKPKPKDEDPYPEEE